MKNKQKASSCRTRSAITGSKVINSHGYNVANFNVLDIPVRRNSKTGRLVSGVRQSSKKSSFK